MTSKHNINESLKQLYVTASGRLDQRVHGAIDETLAGKHTNTIPKKGRRIMVGRLSKLAVAAAVLVAVLLGLNMIHVPNSGGVAWAQIPDRVAAIGTFIFDMTITVTDNSAEPAEQHTAQSTFYLSEEHGFRMDIGADGTLASWYLPPQGDAMTVLLPSEKTWFVIPIPAGQRGKLPEEYKDPAAYVRRFLAQPYRELGPSTIDGVAVQGVEVADPPTDGEELDNAVGRLWVDAETELPVRVEIEGTSEGNPVRWQIDFTWSAMVDPALFDLSIPSDYTPPIR